MAAESISLNIIFTIRSRTSRANNQFFPIFNSLKASSEARQRALTRWNIIRHHFLANWRHISKHINFSNRRNYNFSAREVLNFSEALSEDFSLCSPASKTIVSTFQRLPEIFSKIFSWLLTKLLNKSKILEFR